MELAVEHGIKIVNPEFQEMKRDADAKRDVAKKTEPEDEPL